MLLVVVGPVLAIGNILGFADLMMLSMVFPNVVGMIILTPHIARVTRDYAGRLAAGRIRRTG